MFLKQDFLPKVKVIWISLSCKLNYAKSSGTRWMFNSNLSWKLVKDLYARLN